MVGENRKNLKLMPITSQISSQHVTGFVVGLGVVAAGFYFYEKCQKRVDEWLRQQGIAVPANEGGDYTSMTLEDLVREKETIEDVIAEREHAPQQDSGGKNAPRLRKRGAKIPPHVQPEAA
jgi:hypothetical protein